MEETSTTPKPPLALLVQGRDPAEIVAYACGACGIVARSEEEARRCCDPRCDCGAPAPRGYTLCDGCRKKHHEEQDLKRQAADQAALEAAPRVTYAAYDGRYLYTERLAGGGDGEGYFPDVAELLEHCLDENIDPPALVWACSPVNMGFNADDLISSACEEMYEDAADEIGAAARDSLQAALDAWCEQHGPTSYHPSRIAVDISAEVAAWKAEQEAEARALAAEAEAKRLQDEHEQAFDALRVAGYGSDAVGLGAMAEAAVERNNELHAEAKRLREALGMAGVDPVADVLDGLAAAAEHLLRDHDCDQHGWEGVSRRAALARKHADAIRAALAAKGDDHG